MPGSDTDLSLVATGYTFILFGLLGAMFNWSHLATTKREISEKLQLQLLKMNGKDAGEFYN